MYNRRFTPERITHLAMNEIFVFGSNLAGSHGGGAAHIAHSHFGAIWGQGVGLQGQCYAIPTMHGGVEAIRPYVDEFVKFALLHREYTFLVTRIGCGIAGFRDEEMAPLFAGAIDVENVILPKEFVGIIQGCSCAPVAHEMSWNAKADFLDSYAPLMRQVGDGYSISYYKIKELRAREFRNTVELVNNGFYYTENKEKVIFDKTDAMVAGTRFYSTEFSVRDIAPNEEQTIIEVVNADCIDEGVRLLNMGYNPAVLNMANRQNPGGGVTQGAGAQEETIFRRTDLFRSLYQFAPYAAQYGISRSSFQYPLDRNYGGIYSPCVTLFRANEKCGYKLLAQPLKMAFISVAGMNRPELTPDGMIVDSLVEPIKNKIRTILRIGLRHGHDSLVLGALGCGAFRNPPRHVARLFHEVLDEAEFAKKYRRIVFAILEDHNSYKGHNTAGNYLPFKQEFGQDVCG